MSNKGPKRPGKRTERPRATKRPSAPASPSVNTRKTQAPWNPEGSNEPTGGRTVQEAGSARSLAAPPETPRPTTPEVPAGEGSAVDPNAPFAHYGRSMDLSGHYDTGRTDSLQVLLLFVVMVVCVVGIGLGLGTITQGLTWWGVIDTEAMTPLVVNDDANVLDTASAEKRGEVARRRVVKVQAKAAPVALEPAPVSVRIPDDVVFHEFEVSCPNGFRARGRFRGQRATVRSVPPSVKCTATFKGSEYARHPVTAGQDLRCEFGPTRCVDAR